MSSHEEIFLANRRHDDRVMALSRQYSRNRDTDGMRRLFEALCAAVPAPRRRFVIEVVASMVPNADLARSPELTQMLESAQEGT